MFFRPYATLPPDRVRHAIDQQGWVCRQRANLRLQERSGRGEQRSAESHRGYLSACGGGALPWESIILADEAETIHLADLRGGLKLWRLDEVLKVL